MGICQAARARSTSAAKASSTPGSYCAPQKLRCTVTAWCSYSWPVPTLDPFTPTSRPLDAPDPTRRRLHTAGPLVRLDAPAGGPVWVVTDADLARRVLADLRFAKDPALAPPGWDRRSAG